MNSIKLLFKQLFPDKSSGFYSLIVLTFGLFPLLFSSGILWVLSEIGITQMSNSILYGFIFFGLTAFTMAFALTPTTFVSIMSGYLFSWPGGLGILLAYSLAAVIGRQVGKFVQSRFSSAGLFQSSAHQGFLDNLAKNPFNMLVFARLSPVLPFAMTNLLIAQVRIKPTTYLAGTMVGMFPRTLAFFLLGMNATEIWALIQNPNQGDLSKILFWGLILISSFGLYQVIKRAWVKKQ